MISEDVGGSLRISTNIQSYPAISSLYSNKIGFTQIVRISSAILDPWLSETVEIFVLCLPVFLSARPKRKQKKISFVAFAFINCGNQMCKHAISLDRPCGRGADCVLGKAIRGGDVLALLEIYHGLVMYVSIF